MLAKTIVVCPLLVKFTEETISRNFWNGRNVNQTICDIAWGKRYLEELQLIDVFERDGAYYSFNNKRLYLFRVLYFMKCLDTITVKVISLKGKKESTKYTTHVNGCHVRVRNSKLFKHPTFRHCYCDLKRKLPVSIDVLHNSECAMCSLREYLSESEVDDNYKDNDDDNDDDDDGICKVAPLSNRPIRQKYGKSNSRSSVSSSSSSALNAADVLSGVANGFVAVGLGTMAKFLLNCKVVSPSSIRFTEGRIPSKFENRSDLNDTIFDITIGKVDVSKINLIKVICKNGTYWSLNNRRLYVFRVLNLMGRLPYVEVELLTDDTAEYKRFNTLCRGCHVVLAGTTTTYRNCSCSIGQERRLPGAFSFTNFPVQLRQNTHSYWQHDFSGSGF